MLSNYKFIDQNKERMYVDENNVYHCLLVLGENQDDGILIESEGSSYARYSSFIPNARQLVNQEMKIESYNSRKIITQEEAEIMCAKHLLWLYDQTDGKQANFTNCDLKDINLSYRNLNNAIFKNAKIENTDFKYSEICFSDFSNSKIKNCNFKCCSGDEAIFKEAEIVNCDFTNAYMMNCNITDTKMIDNIIKNTNIENSYIENEEQEQIEESGPALSM